MLHGQGGTRLSIGRVMLMEMGFGGTEQTDKFPLREIPVRKDTKGENTGPV